MEHLAFDMFRAQFDDLTKKRTEPNKTDCYFFDYYQDMWASCPVCRLEEDLEKATKANCENCKHYIKEKQADEINKKKVGL